MLISVVIPVYNNAATLAELHRRARAALEPLGSLEIIFINDGSGDESAREIRRLAALDADVMGIELSRNFGQQAAVTAGLDVASGDWIVIMDADLQDRPEHIPGMLARAQDGYDMVYAIGRAEADPGWRRSAAEFFAATFRTLSRTRLPWRTGLFRVLNRRVLEAVRRFPERQRFVLGLLTWAGYRTLALELPRDRRGAGRSEFSPLKLIALASDALLSFSIVPLRLALLLGTACSAAGFAWGAFLVIKRLLVKTAPLGFSSVICAILLLGGIQLLILGLVGEYIGRIYVEVQRRPLYLVQEIFGRAPRPVAGETTSESREAAALAGPSVS